MAHAVGDALGLVSLAPLRQAGHLIGDMDMAAFAGVSRHADGFESRSRPAFSRRHQSADRSRLAVLAARGAIAGLDVLRGGRLHRQEPMVAGDAGYGALPSACELPVA